MEFLLTMNHMLNNPIDIVVGIASICIISLLMRIYWKNYMHFRTPFAFGLLLFASFLLIDNVIYVTSFLFYQNSWGAFEHVVMFLVNLSELIGLTILLKVTLE